MGFVANFVRFPAVQKFWKSVYIWQSYRDSKCGNFFETQCSFIITVAMPMLQLQMLMLLMVQVNLIRSISCSTVNVLLCGSNNALWCFGRITSVFSFTLTFHCVVVVMCYLSLDLFTSCAIFTYLFTVVTA